MPAPDAAATPTSATADAPDEPIAAPERRDRWRWSLLALGTSALALRAVTALGRLRTADEGLWMLRTDGFSQAVVNGDFARATANIRELDTMPGVTTMWIGSAAKAVWAAGRRLGLWAAPEVPFVTSGTGLVAGQLGMAVATAALLVLVVVLLRWWVGRGPALAAGVLLATEPFFIAHGAVLHTDELLALFGGGALVATAVALGVPKPTPVTGRPWMAPLAGALWAGTFLTKLTAVLFLPAASLLALWALVAALRGRAAATADRAARRAAALRAVRTAAVTVVTAVVVAVAAYPALWVAPREEVRAMWRSVNLGATGHAQFFLGELTATPGPTFYAVALPLRMTPWFLAGTLVAVVVLVARRDLRPYAAALACMAGPLAVGTSLASKQFDRYGLPLLVVAAVALGLAAANVVGAVRHRWVAERRGAVGLVAAAALALHAARIVPWGLAYFNPALGGAETAERAILVGWGEVSNEVPGLVLELEGGRCRSVRISSVLESNGRPKADVDGATYVSVYVNHRQRVPEDHLAELLEGRPLAATIERGGVTYVQLYGPPEGSDDAAAGGDRAGERLCDATDAATP
jgi:hypothetical protein